MTWRSCGVLLPQAARNTRDRRERRIRAATAPGMPAAMPCATRTYRSCGVDDTQRDTRNSPSASRVMLRLVQDLLRCVLEASPSQTEELVAWWRATRDVRGKWPRTIERALVGGAHADRLGFAFAAG